MTNRHFASGKVLRKQAYWSNVACEMGKAAARNDSRKIYQLLSESTGKKKQISTPTLLSKDNKLFTSQEDRIERWRTYSKSLLAIVSASIVVLKALGLHEDCFPMG